MDDDVNAFSPRARRLDSGNIAATLSTMAVEPDWKAVGDRLRKACDAKGLSRHWQISKALGEDAEGKLIPLATISRWLNGKQPIEKHRERICRVLGISQDWLLWGDEGPPRQEDVPTPDAVAKAQELLKRLGYKVELAEDEPIKPRRPATGMSGIQAKPGAPTARRTRKK